MRSIQSIVVLTGAGVSAESGIKTFRDADGLWEQHRIEDVASPEGFAANPGLVHNFYNLRRRQLVNDVEPNSAHLALAELENRFNGSYLLVTQNIDDLHERAGSGKVVHMHGELLKIRCQISGRVYPWRKDLTVQEQCDCCGKQGQLRPHVVWFGEMPLEMERINRALSEADLFVAIGTSGNVYPAAGFVLVAAQSGAQTLEINLEPSSVQSAFQDHVYGPAGERVPEFVERLLRSNQVDECGEAL